MKNMKLLTKEELTYIVENWGKLSEQEIAEKLDRKPASVSSYVGILRKLGVNLPKKTLKGQRAIMMEFAEEWKKANPKP